MLTIGQLAKYVGVTVRAVRHYHQRGLLAEPARDASGYRRYDAQAVLDLIRIKVLSDAGVPLAQVREVLDARPEHFARSVADIDEALRQQIRELERRRQRIADLIGGERLFLPAELVGFLDELRALGISPRTVEIERDGWILMLAGDPQRASRWLGEKRTHLADPEFQRLYHGYDEAVDWDPDDPRLGELAGAMARFVEQRHLAEHDVPPNSNFEDPTVVALLTSHFDDASSPSLEHLSELCAEKLAGGREVHHDASSRHAKQLRDDLGK